MPEIPDLTTMEDIRSAFKELELNDKSSISKEEISRQMKNFSSLVSDESLKKLIQMMSPNADGSTDLNEFLGLVDFASKVQQGDEEIRNLFELIDQDQDGFITESEITKMMKSLGEKVRKKEIRSMMKAGDISNDGKISFVDFKIMLQGFMN